MLPILCLAALAAPRTPAPDPAYLSVLGPTAQVAGTYAPPAATDRRQVAFGIALFTLRLSRQELRKQVLDVLAEADRTGYPVLIHVDDWNFPPDTWPDPAMAEWTGFPAPGQRTGPPVKRRWLNWGSWVVTGPPANYESPAYRRYLRERLVEDVARPVARQLAAWRRAGRAHLLAGLVVGWESGYYTMPPADPANLPRTADGKVMSPDEAGDTGFAALAQRGWTGDRLAAEARKRGKSEKAVFQELMLGVIHDYIQWMCAQVRHAGIPRERIYTHLTGMGGRDGLSEQERSDGRILPLWVAVNGESRPGYTMTAEWSSVSASRKATGTRPWGAVEMEVTPATTTREGMLAHLEALGAAGARVMCLYGWWEEPGRLFAVRGTGAPDAIKEWLAKE